MYVSTLEPLLIECQEALRLVKEGEIDSARSRIDRVRYLRSVVSRTREQEDVTNPSFVDAAASSSVELISSYRKLAENVNQHISTIDELISKVAQSFTLDELFDSISGLNLFLDSALPAIWDFNQDVAVITDSYGLDIRDVLRQRGQKKFIWLSDHEVSDGHEVIENDGANESGADFKHEGFEDTLVLFANTEPDHEALHGWVGESVPRMALFSRDHSEAVFNRFNDLRQTLSAAVIKAATTQWIPRLSVEQYLSNLPTLVTKRSALDLAPQFAGRPVLILSPGPSLQCDLEILKAVQHSFITIAPVKSLNSLFDAGVAPDFAIWQDPRDHTYAVPDRPEIASIPLILSECCHPAFYSASFKTHFYYPDPSLLSSPTCNLLHGETPPVLAGTSVSTLATVLSISLGANSVTLLGQDLSIAGGHYVGDNEPGQTVEDEDHVTQGLTCESIAGGRVPTLPNYFSFIGEFRRIAEAFRDTHQLINCTSDGAFLEGWQHMPLDEHPLLKAGASLDVAELLLEPTDPSLPAEVTVGLDQLSTQLDTVSQISDGLYQDSLKLLAGTLEQLDVLDLGDKELKRLMHEECPMLALYLSQQTMAVKAAVDSNQSLEDNLRMSADYYSAISRAALRLRGAVDGAKSQLAELES